MNGAVRASRYIWSRLPSGVSFLLLLVYGIVLAWIYPLAPIGPAVDGILLVLALVLVWRYPNDEASRVTVAAQVAILLHMAIALFVLPYVRDYYNTQLSPDDTRRYYNEARAVVAALPTDPQKALQLLIPNGLTSSGHSWVYLISYLLTFGSYAGICVFFSWLGALGAFLFAKALAPAMAPSRNCWYVPLVFFLPSVLFWTSWPLKDSLSFLSLAVLTYGLSTYLHRGRFQGLIWILLAEGSFILIRPYFLCFGLLAMLFVGTLHLRVVRGRRFATVRGVIHLTFLLQGAILLVFLASHNFYLQISSESPTGALSLSYWEEYQQTSVGGGSALRLEQQDQAATSPTAAAARGTQTVQAAQPSAGTAASGTQAVSAVALVSRMSTVWSYLSIRVSYLFTVLFRPLPWEAHNLFSLLSSFENLALLVLAAGVVWNWRAVIRTLRDQPIVLFSAVVAALFVGAFSFQVVNLGTMTRLKVNVLPFLLPFAALALEQGWQLLSRTRVRFPAARASQ